MTRTVIAGALGECGHVAGVHNFLRLAEAAGWRTIFLGPAVSVPNFLTAVRRERKHLKIGEPLLVGVSYRLAPETGERLLGELAEGASDLHERGVRFAFGGTPAMAERARSLGFFEKLFDGSESPEQVLAYLKGQPAQGAAQSDFPESLVERIRWRAPYPVLDQQFGLPSLDATLESIARIVEAEALDVISLATDQEAQENFFHPERQDARCAGAGGAPVRSPEDFRALYEAGRRGDFPLMRACSGTDDFIHYAELLATTIHNAWCTVPLLWFNRMDGRGPWGLQASIREHQALMTWCGERDLPVELDEAQQWGMRDAPDVIYVVTAFLAAYNAKKSGVKDYVAELVFNSPAGSSDAMDLAKIAAVLQLIDPLGGPGFRIWRQTRLGILSHPADIEAARGHLAAATYLHMALKPHICHIVGHTEAQQAVTAEDVIEASKIVRRAIQDGLGGPEMLSAPEVQERTQRLMSEAVFTLETIRELAAPGIVDPWTDPATLTRAVTDGILDAPQLANNAFGRGRIRTRILDGRCEAVDRSGHALAEKERLSVLQ